MSEPAAAPARRIFVSYASCAAGASSAVRVEYELAISLAKDVVPVALDDTPFPPALAPFNGLSLASFFVPRDPSSAVLPSLAPLLARLQRR